MIDIARIVALGASNLTRGFETVVSTARTAWGSEIQVLAALGHGRSYGVSSRIAIRTLPSILDSGLWQKLEFLPQVPTRALVTDVGNDIMYGFSAQQILTWVEEALSRLQRVSRDIILTDLPMESIQRMSPRKYLVFRSIFFPFCPLSLAQVLKTAHQVNTGLEDLSTTCDVRLIRLNPAWYGMDPIHIRPSLWQSAWQEILNVRSAESGSDRSMLEGLRLYFMAPERRWILGVEQYTPQPGIALRSGGRVWLY